MAKSKAQQALEFVRRAAERADSGTDLHNAFFGNGGEYGKLFPTRDERKAFSTSPEYQEIVKIRERLDTKSRRSGARRS